MNRARRAYAEGRIRKLEMKLAGNHATTSDKNALKRWQKELDAALPMSLREHLEWSWNYSIAEGFAEDTIKNIARAISSGIACGEDVADQGLVEQFADTRTHISEATKRIIIDPEWHPASKDDHVLLQSLIDAYYEKHGVSNE